MLPGRVKVWNDNVHPHTERFKGDMLTVPAGGFIEMDWEDAVQFKGQFTGVTRPLPNGNPDPRGYKMLRIEGHGSAKPALVNHATGQRVQTQAELDASLKEVEGRRASDPEADKAASSELAELRAMVAKQQALLEQLTQKRGRGRPRKEASA